MKKIFKIGLIFSVVIILLAVAGYFYFFVGKSPKQDSGITWGVDFSQMQAQALGLDWKDVYLSAINDLGVKNIKIHTQWDWIEGQKGKYFFDDTDWQLQQAKNKGVKVIYVVGMKSGRWPECHVPMWAERLNKQQQQEEILKYIKTTILRYKGNSAIINWQVENEPLFNFGVCPWYDKSFLKEEVALAKSLDSSRKIIISDSGEQSNWFEAAKIGDIVGITMYRKVWAHITDGFGFNVDWPFSPVTYWIPASRAIPVAEASEIVSVINLMLIPP